MEALPAEHTTVSDLQHLLDAEADDERVADCFKRLLQSWNLEAAACGWFAAAGRVCHLRPHLARRLLQLPIDCLVQCGADSVEGMLRYVRYFLDQRRELLLEDAGAEGLRWLETALPEMREMLQELAADATRRFPAD